MFLSTCVVHRQVCKDVGLGKTQLNEYSLKELKRSEGEIIFNNRFIVGNDYKECYCNKIRVNLLMASSN